MFKRPLLHIISVILVIGFTFSYASADLDALLDKVSKYEHGKSREFLTELNEKVVESLASADKQKEMERRLVDILDSDATIAAKEFICSELSFMGSETAVPALIKLLENEKTVTMALYALQRVSAENVNEQLRLFLAEAKGNKHIAIINTLGERRDSKAVSLLKKSLNSADSKLVLASAAALGKIGGDQATSVLKSAIPKTTIDVQPALLDAYLQSADQYKNEAQKALDIYKEVFASEYPVHLRSAALVGIVKTSGSQSVKILQTTLNEEENPLQSMAISLIRKLPSGTDLNSFIVEFPELSPFLKIQMLASLTDRKEAVGRELALQVLADENQSLRLAALKSLAVLGNENDILLLAGTAAKSKGVEKESARKSLSQLKGQNIDQLILSKIPDSDTPVKAELIHSIGRRNIKNSVDLLFETLHSPQNEVRKESYQSLSIVAGENDFKNIIDLLVNPKNKANLQRTRSLAAKVATKYAKSDVQVNLISDKLATINDLELKSALLNILGKTGNEKALQILRKTTKDNNDELKTAAITALALWPNKEPLTDLFEIVQKNESEANTLIALRGYIRILGVDNSLSNDQKVPLYKKAMEYSEKINEKQMIIKGLAETGTISSWNLLSSYLGRDELKMELHSVLLDMAPDAAGIDLEKTKTVLSQIISTTSNDEHREMAQTMLDNLSVN